MAAQNAPENAAEEARRSVNPVVRLLAMLWILLPLAAAAEPGGLHDRPARLVAALPPGDLRQRLQACLARPPVPTAFVIGHRGAPLGFPEHTRESYAAAAAQGAGVVECDVTFTRDRELVCRHSQCDLHTTTNILQTPLAATCSQPFTPADPASGRRASARCCASDLVLAQLRTLCGRRDSADPAATTVDAYLAGGGEQCGTLVTHRESIAQLRALGVAMTPELKAPEVAMPFGGDYTQERYARQMIEEYRAAGVDAAQVAPQSYALSDIAFWLREYPAFGRRAVWLDGRYEEQQGFDANDPATWRPSMPELKSAGVRTLAPPMPVLLALDGDRIVSSAYARAARAAGLRLVTWTLERSGPLAEGGGFYYGSIRRVIRNDGDTYRVLDVLARDAGIAAIFSDWPATAVLYANCTGR